jgi:drug/metabolite transporter (DMT)-like permease
MTREEWIGVLQAAAATGFFAFGAILVRWAAPLSPVEITSLRLLLAAGAVAGVARAVSQPLRVDGPTIRRLLPVGIVCALHFLSFIAALALTSVAHALTLTYTAPLFIAPLARLLLGEPLPPRTVPGTLLALTGVAVLAGLEPALSPRILAGDLCAIGSAVTFALYSVFGRRERARLPLLAYATWVYLIAGLVTAPFAWGVLLRPLPVGALLAVAGMAVFPSALGHTLYNAAVRRLHPSLPNLIATQEVTGGILLAWLLLGESPPATVLAGVGLTLAGVGLVLGGRARRRR